MRRNQTLKIVLIALVCVATMLVPIPASGGYAGDGVILMRAFLMGPVNAAFAQALVRCRRICCWTVSRLRWGTLVIKACVSPAGSSTASDAVRPQGARSAFS